MKKPNQGFINNCWLFFDWTKGFFIVLFSKYLLHFRNFISFVCLSLWFFFDLMSSCVNKRQRGISTAWYQHGFRVSSRKLQEIALRCCQHGMLSSCLVLMFLAYCGGTTCCQHGMLSSCIFYVISRIAERLHGVSTAWCRHGFIDLFRLKKEFFVSIVLVLFVCPSEGRRDRVMLTRRERPSRKVISNQALSISVYFSGITES